MLILISAGLLLCAAGCAFGRQATNEPIDPTLMQQLTPGRTTAGDVATLLGAPVEVRQLGRRAAWLYEASTTKSTVTFMLIVNLVNQDTRSDRLWLFFDENDVLLHWGGHFAGHRPQYSFPWEDLHEESDNAAADEDRAGVVPARRGQ